ncbi:methyltransferase [Fragilaria crotonensis]|nr:methyltransferase [Fragilaria crotonensis]
MVIDSWFASVQRKPWSNSCTESEEDEEDNICSVCDSRETKALSQALSIHVAISQKDPILAEEIGFQGSHMLLTKLIQYDASMYPEQDQDAIMDLQDLACEIASTASSFPLKLAPISNLHERLPLCISFSPKHTLFIQQVTSRQSAQQDVGFVLWPSAVALSQWLIDHPTLVLTAQSILELGAGCGLVGLTAAMLVQGQKQVDKNGNGVNDENSDPRIILTDFNQVVLDNLRLNIDLNDVQATAQKLDFYQQSGHAEFWVDDSKIGTDSQQEQVDLILAADMICQPSDAVAAANAIHDALKPGGKAIVVCGNGKHRFGVDCFEDECKRVGLTVETSNAIANMESLKLTAGYVEGMSLSMFTIDKI